MRVHGIDSSGPQILSVYMRACMLYCALCIAKQPKRMMIVKEAETFTVRTSTQKI